MQQYVLKYGSYVILESVFFGDVSMKVKMNCEFVAGWTSFTVCGKLRRLVKVKKVIFHSTHVFELPFYVDL
jgi:hypothetical protein